MFCNVSNIEVIDCIDDDVINNKDNERKISYTNSQQEKTLSRKTLIEKFENRKGVLLKTQEKSYLGFKYMRLLANELKIIKKKKKKEYGNDNDNDNDNDN